jgi:hypothetical protein
VIIPTQDPAPAVRARPATVSVAFWLQLGVAAVLLLFAVLTVVEAVVYDGLIDRAAELTNADPDEVSSERGFNVEWAVLTGLPAVALLGLFAGTAVPVRSGSNVARILTCVAAGFPMVCCAAFGGLGALMALPLLALEDPEQLGEDPFWPDESPFYEKLYELQGTGVDSWLSGILPMLLMLGFAMSTAAAVLLLVPPSNRYYRPPAPPHVPPAYPPVYPAPPGYVLVPASSVPWITGIQPQPPPPPSPPPQSEDQPPPA